jgi:hypothetical protein
MIYPIYSTTVRAVNNDDATNGHPMVAAVARDGNIGGT